MLKKCLSVCLSIITMLAVTTITALAAGAPPEPPVTEQDGAFHFGTFITSELDESQKTVLRDLLENDRRFMSIDCTTEAPLFSFCLVPDGTDFLGFQAAESNGFETVFASFTGSVDCITFEAAGDQFIFKSAEKTTQIKISYLIDTTVFPKDAELPEIGYDWQRYIPAVIKDDDGLEQVQATKKETIPAVDNATKAVEAKAAATTNVKNYVWIGAGALVALLAIVAIVKMITKK